MKYIIVVLMLVALCGCDVIAPNVSKAKTEKRQHEQLVKQNEILERIAVALEETN